MELMACRSLGASLMSRLAPFDVASDALAERRAAVLR
jgi:hypothetical protein